MSASSVPMVGMIGGEQHRPGVAMRDPDPEIAKLQGELDRLRGTIAEKIAEKEAAKKEVAVQFTIGISVGVPGGKPVATMTTSAGLQTLDPRAAWEIIKAML